MILKMWKLVFFYISINGFCYIEFFSGTLHFTEFQKKNSKKLLEFNDNFFLQSFLTLLFYKIKILLFVVFFLFFFY
jgi:hypothetical protein